MIVTIRIFIVYAKESTLTLLSRFICALKTLKYTINTNNTNKSAATDPRLVPRVPPAAPYAAA